MFRNVKSVSTRIERYYDNAVEIPFDIVACDLAVFRSRIIAKIIATVDFTIARNVERARACWRPFPKIQYELYANPNSDERFVVGR